MILSHKDVHSKVVLPPFQNPLADSALTRCKCDSSRVYASANRRGSCRSADILLPLASLLAPSLAASSCCNTFLSPEHGA